MIDALDNKKDWKANHLKIIDAYTDHVESNMKAPKVTDLARITGLSRPTIYKHLQKMQLTEISNKFKVRAMTILEGIAKKAEDGDVPAAKLMLQLAFNWNEKKILDVTSTNKSLKVVFTNPSPDQMKKIVENDIQETDYEEVDDEWNGIEN